MNPLKGWGDNSGKVLFENKDQHLIPSTHIQMGGEHLLSQHWGGRDCGCLASAYWPASLP